MEYAKSTGDVETSTRKKGYAPTDNDWELNRVSFDDAENGVVVECSYRLKQDIKDKLRKQEKAGMGYCSDYREPIKHVFEDKADAKAFLVKELDKIWMG